MGGTESMTLSIQFTEETKAGLGYTSRKAECDKAIRRNTQHVSWRFEGQQEVGSRTAGSGESVKTVGGSG